MGSRMGRPSRPTPFTPPANIDLDWRGRALCRFEDPELFFAVGNSGPALKQNAQAKSVCRRCPVMDACLNWALNTGQEAGVWGGMTEDERRRFKKSNPKTRAFLLAKRAS